MLVSPWFSPFLDEKLGGKTMVVLTNQVSEPLIEAQPGPGRQLIVLLKLAKEVRLITTMPHTSFEDELELELATKYKVEKIEKRPIQAVQGPQALSQDLLFQEKKLQLPGQVSLESHAVRASAPMAEPVVDTIDDFLFEASPEGEDSSFSSVITAVPDRPICIVAEKSQDDEYIHTLQLLCKELYRVKVGGHAIATVVTQNRREIEEEMSAFRHIFVADDSQEKFFDLLTNKGKYEFENTTVAAEKLVERLRELFAQGFGYIIFYVDLDQKRRAVLEGAITKVRHTIPELKFVKLKDLSEDKKRSISTIAWGFVEPKVSGNKLDFFFGESEKEFYRRLRRGIIVPKYQPYIRESLEDDEEGTGAESPLHYTLKSLAVQYLCEERKIPLVNIQIEQPLPGDDTVVPDIYIASMNLAIEIETLYGTGVNPIRKIVRTIQKYKGRVPVWIVVPNLQLLLFQKQIGEMVTRLKESGLKFDVYGVNVKNDTLILLDEIHRLGKKMIMTE